MTKPLPPSQLKDVETPTIPRNAAQRTEKRTKGLITGWMKNRKRGAPLKITPSAASLKKKKKKKSACAKAAARDAAIITEATTDMAVTAMNASASKPKASAASATPPGKSTTGQRKHSAAASKPARSPYAKSTPPEPKKLESKRNYYNWSVEPFKSALARAVEAKLRGGDSQLAAGDVIIPPATLRRRVKEVKQAAAEEGKDSIIYLKDFQRQKEDARTLTCDGDRDYLQQLITLRDLKNNPMSRAECFGVIQTLAGVDFKTAENHWYHLQRKKLLPQLKNNGKVRKAQATTTKRSGVTTEKMLRWHGICDEALAELDRRNSGHKDWEEIKSSNKIDSFWGNTDESCFMASDGTWSIVSYSIVSYLIIKLYFVMLLSLISLIVYYIYQKAMSTLLHPTLSKNTR